MLSRWTTSRGAGRDGCFRQQWSTLRQLAYGRFAPSMSNLSSGRTTMAEAALLVRHARVPTGHELTGDTRHYEIVAPAGGAPSAGVRKGRGPRLSARIRATPPIRASHARVARRLRRPLRVPARLALAGVDPARASCDAGGPIGHEWPAVANTADNCMQFADLAVAAQAPETRVLAGFRGRSRVARNCLKIVLSPVRVRVSPLRGSQIRYGSWIFYFRVE